ncbi:hypothetical protein GWI33_000491, partial [Rhynchophorus ferrugineus]
YNSFSVLDPSGKFAEDDGNVKRHSPKPQIIRTEAGLLQRDYPDRGGMGTVTERNNSSRPLGRGNFRGNRNGYAKTEREGSIWRRGSFNRALVVDEILNGPFNEPVRIPYQIKSRKPFPESEILEKGRGTKAIS